MITSNWKKEKIQAKIEMNDSEVQENYRTAKFDKRKRKSTAVSFWRIWRIPTGA